MQVFMTKFTVASKSRDKGHIYMVSGNLILTVTEIFHRNKADEADL